MRLNFILTILEKLKARPTLYSFLCVLLMLCTLYIEYRVTVGVLFDKTSTINKKAATADGRSVELDRTILANQHVLLEHMLRLDARISQLEQENVREAPQQSFIRRVLPEALVGVAAEHDVAVGAGRVLPVTAKPDAEPEAKSAPAMLEFPEPKKTF